MVHIKSHNFQNPQPFFFFHSHYKIKEKNRTQGEIQRPINHIVNEININILKKKEFKTERELCK